MNTHPVVKGKLVCVALNDQAQADALNETFSEAPYKAPPQEPVLYFKPRNTWNGDEATLTPEDGQSFVVGASLAVVIGKECCRVSTDEALTYVGSYSILHDVSLPEETYYRPDIKGKCLDGSAPLSANTATPEAVSSPDELSVVISVNGEEKATLNHANLHRSVPEIISKISRIMTLDAGDVIAVGFIGDRVPVASGDTVVSTIDKVGSLTTFIGGAK